MTSRYVPRRLRRRPPPRFIIRASHPLSHEEAANIRRMLLRAAGVRGALVTDPQLSVEVVR